MISATASGYFTVLVPYSTMPTPWHPTESKGPWSVLTRGAFATLAEATAWADAKLEGQPCVYRWVTFE